MEKENFLGRPIWTVPLLITTIIVIGIFTRDRQNTPTPKEKVLSEITWENYEITNLDGTVISPESLRSLGWENYYKHYWYKDVLGLATKDHDWMILNDPLRHNQKLDAVTIRFRARVISHDPDGKCEVIRFMEDSLGAPKELRPEGLCREMDLRDLKKLTPDSTGPIDGVFEPQTGAIEGAQFLDPNPDLSVDDIWRIQHDKPRFIHLEGGDYETVDRIHVVLPGDEGPD